MDAESYTPRHGAAPHRIRPPLQPQTRPHGPAPLGFRRIPVEAVDELNALTAEGLACVPGRQGTPSSKLCVAGSRGRGLPMSREAMQKPYTPVLNPYTPRRARDPDGSAPASTAGMGPPRPVPGRPPDAAADAFAADEVDEGNPKSAHIRTTPSRDRDRVIARVARHPRVPARDRTGKEVRHWPWKRGSWQRVPEWHRSAALANIGEQLESTAHAPTREIA